MSDATSPRLSRRGRWTLIGIGVGLLALVAVANVHLVYVSVTTPPDCVPHLKVPDEGGTAFRAAKSAC